MIVTVFQAKDFFNIMTTFESASLLNVCLHLPGDYFTRECFSIPIVALLSTSSSKKR